MNDKERADALRREADLFQQSDPTRAACLWCDFVAAQVRGADELDPPQAKQPSPATKRAKPRKGGR